MTAPGTSQSPIDFCKNEIKFVDHLPSIDFSYPQSTDVTVVNTGSPDEDATIRADVPAGAAHITLCGARYDLSQFHWHTPSEHEIEGRHTPLEMHLVHRRKDGAFLVIGVFIERGRSNKAIDPIFRELPEQSGGTRIVPDVRLRGLLPDKRESFHYSGSLTTPPFTEPVSFIVFANSITLSRQQIDSFQKLFENNNCRKVQQLNGREVLCDACDIFDAG
ncbi:MAG: carbonic anhydrase [Pseudonocardiales bacterium]